MKHKLLPFINLIALSATIFVNYYFNSGVLDGKTMATISDTYPSYFTPAGYTFAIWGLIYLFLFGYVFYSFRKSHSQNIHVNLATVKVGYLFTITCILNSLWVVTWLQEFIGISVIIMTLLYFTLLRIVTLLPTLKTDTTWKSAIFIRIPFAIYTGWITVAIIANIAVYLTKISWSGWGISTITWTYIMVMIAALVNVYVVVKRRDLWVFALVGTWALVGVALKNISDSKSLAYFALSVSVIIIIVTLLTILSKKQYR